MISVVVPVYNEEEIVPLLHDAVVRAMSKLRDTWEVVYVNDGSADSTLQLLRALQLNDPNVVVVDLSRNCLSQARLPIPPQGHFCGASGADHSGAKARVNVLFVPLPARFSTRIGALSGPPRRAYDRRRFTQPRNPP